MSLQLPDKYRTYKIPRTGREAAAVFRNIRPYEFS